jgi:hypothetical protein
VENRASVRSLHSFAVDVAVSLLSLIANHRMRAINPGSRALAPVKCRDAAGSACAAQPQKGTKDVDD